MAYPSTQCSSSNKSSIGDTYSSNHTLDELELPYQLPYNVRTHLKTLVDLNRGTDKTYTWQQKKDPKKDRVLSHPYDFINISNLQDILKYLMDYGPASVRIADGRGLTSLHIVSMSKGITFEVFQLIYNAWPGGDNIGRLPIHELCLDGNLDEDTWFLAFSIS